MSRARTPSLALLALLSLLLVNAEARGQALGAARPDRGVEVTPFVGLVAPLAGLSSDPGSFATEIAPSLTAGGTLTYWLRDHLGLAVQGFWAPARLSVRPTQFTGPIPNDLGDADYLAATVNLTYRLRPAGPASVLEPYFTVGAGARRLDFDPIAERDVSDATDPVATVAAGADVAVSSTFALRLEVRDLVSRFDATASGETTTQNDVVVTVGIGLWP